MDNHNYSNITTVLNEDPNHFDLAIVSIDQNGNSGNLNQAVLSSLKYNIEILDSINLDKGYYLLRGNLVPILFIVTIGTEFTGVLLKKNLTQALEKFHKDFRGKRVWIPLMGTGDGGLEYVDSYDTTISVLKNFKDVSFTIAIPDSKKGNEFVKRFRPDNFQNKGNKSEENEGSPKVKGNPTSKPLQSGYDKLPQYNIHRLIRDVLNIEYNLNLFIEVGIIRNNFTQKIDLADDKKNAYVEIIDKSMFIGKHPVGGFTTGDGTSNNEIMVNVFSQVENQVKFLQSAGSEVKKYFAVFSDSFSKFDIEYAKRWFASQKSLPVTVSTISEIINLATKHDINSDSYLKTDTTDFKLTEEVEVQIDRDRKFLIGLNVGTEIKDYDVIFLPKSSHGGIGQNGIAAHILELFGRARAEIEFSSQDLEKIGYKWVSVYTETKSIEVCFVVSKDINKNSLNFSDNLKNSIYNFSGAMSALNPPSEVTKIFIPLLGTGQAQLPIADSFNLINEVLPLFKEYFKNPQIRINFPLEIERDVLLNYANVLVTFHKLNEIDNLRQEINRLFDNEDDQLPLNNLDPTKDKIPFHLDNVETIDKLNREPVAKSLARLINAEIFDNKKMNYSFMVHLQGEWGSGKSTFLNLVKQNLDTEKRKWVVINYNAWQNQHISPPWWSFIDQVYRQSLEKLSFWEKIFLCVKEKYRRVLKYSSAYKAMLFSISVLLILVLFNYKREIFSILIQLFSFNEEAKESFTVEGLSKLFLAIGVIIGVVISLAKFFSFPLLMQSSKEANSFMQRAADPMNKIKEHFNSLVGDINKMGFDIAVFIDDIDRCNRQYTVQLLEGIQTLFKEKKVLYIVAGDKSWITSCFENNYSEFSKNLTAKGENLGDLFLEKAFQLSIRMPEVSEKSKENFWKEIIGAKEDSNDKEKTKLTEVERTEIKKKVVDSYANNENNSTTLNNLETEYNISSEVASDIAIEALDENVEDVRHLLLSFHKSLNPNPRSIKRLANYYTMYRNTLIAEKADFLPTKLFRWLLLEDKYPILVKQFLKDGKIEKVDKFVEAQNFSNQQENDLLELLNGIEENDEDPLAMNELIKIFKK